MTIWTDTNGLVRQADASDPGEPVALSGCIVTVLTSSQLAAFNDVPQPNGGITFDGSTFGTLPVPPPPPPPPNANQALIDRLNSLTLTAGGEGDQIRQAVVTVLQAQPPVPAV